MAILNRKIRILSASFAAAALFIAACGDDTTSPPSQAITPDGGDSPDASSNAGSGGNGGSGGTAGAGGNAGNAGNTANAGDAGTMVDLDGSMSTQVQFLVPTNGGDVDLPFGDETITFTFPASAAGLNVVLTLADATDITGFENEDFSVVIRMQPDGHVFTDPVIVTPSNGDLIAMTFPQSANASAPEQLELASDGSGFELNHFSFLTFGGLMTLCASTGVTETPNAQLCANEGAASTLRTYSCDKYRFCSHTEGYCCVQPGDASGSDCVTSSTGLLYTFNHLPDVSGDFPYCGAVPGDASIGTPGDGGLPNASDGGDGGLSCSEAIAALAGSGPSAVACPNAGGFPATCVAALDWQLGVSCDNFCATMGLTCIYNGEASGTSSGVASCADSFAQPSPSVTSWCGNLSDTDKWCHCD
jgi:hypothetical protein